MCKITQGNIIFVDYELSSWKYQEKECGPSPYAKYITGELPLPKRSGIIIKRGFVLPATKGMGSAYGAQWKPNPNKPNDMVFLGPPNTIKRLFIPTGKDGYWVQVKYGDDGWAVAIRHETEHSPNSQHTNPHDHVPVIYDPHTHAPDWKNTPEINYPNGAPEFKRKKDNLEMTQQEHYGDIATNLVYDEEAMRFKTISEFKYCVSHGAEIVIEWDGVEYGIFWDYASKRHYIGHDSPETNIFYETPDELLEHRVGKDRLRDIITQAVVIDRTL